MSQNLFRPEITVRNPVARIVLYPFVVVINAVLLGTYRLALRVLPDRLDPQR